ncbi:MAG: hypothetical protein NT175_00190 [Bacteroidetes bacterium]|nr:hypothetical protein [Bacteroidota bacterium]
MSSDFLNKLYTHFEGNPIFSYGDLFSFVQGEFPDLAGKTINWKIHQLKSKGILSHISRGIYSLNKKKEYNPELSPYLKRVYNKVKKDLPFINFCVWDSRWFNEFMIHQIFRYYIVVETEKDATDSVFNTLSDFSKKVFLNPDKEIFRRYIINYDEVLIVKPLISEAPLFEIENIKVPAIEKLLIDCLIDVDLFAAQQDEMDNIYQTVYQKYNVNLNKIRRYARRRDQLSELENKIEQLNLNLQ